MKINHSKEFYKKWMRENGFVESDVAWHIFSYTGENISDVRVLDYLVENFYSAKDLKHLISS